MNPLVWPVTATGYIEACQPLPWRQSFDLGPYAWIWSGWRRYGSPPDKMEPESSRSGETEPAPKGLGETEPASLRPGETEPEVGRDGNRVLGVGRDGARTQGVGRDGNP